RIRCLRISLRLPLRLVDPNEFLSLTGLVAKDVVSDSIKPGGKLRLATEVSDVLVSTNECFLGEIISQSDIRARELSQKATYRRLMAANQLAKGVLVTINEDSCEQIGIGQLHITF